MKVFFEIPQENKKHFNPVDLKTIQDLMSALMTVAVGPSIDQYANRTILPGEQEMNEKFMNAELIRRVFEANNTVQFTPLSLPSDNDIKRAKVAKLVYEYLQDQQKHGNACSLHSVQNTMGQLVEKLQKEVENSKSKDLAEFVFNLNTTNDLMKELNSPSLFSKSMPWERRISPTVLEIEVDKFFREQYDDGYVITDIDEYGTLADKFLQKYRIGVPKDTITDLFLKVCPCK